MTAEQALLRFRNRLLKIFHHGHECGLVEREYREMLKEIEAPVTGGHDNE